MTVDYVTKYIALITVDYTGIALVIGAISAAVGPIVTALLQWRASRIHDKDKKEAIAARTEQNTQIEKVHSIVSAVAPVVLAEKTGEHPISSGQPTQPTQPEQPKLP